MPKFNNYNDARRVAYGDSDPEAIDVTPAKPLPVDLVKSKTAFGEISVAELTAQVQVQFPYNINAAQVTAFGGNGGSATHANASAVLSTGTASDGFGLMISNDVVKFNAGQGGLGRFTNIFTTGVANSFQIMGVGNALNGFFFGYNGAAFGVLHRTGGNPEFRTLTVSTGSSTAEDITITLDGVAVTDVSVTASGDATITALEIAEHSYFDVAEGWGATAIGATVLFTSIKPEPKLGTYSLSSATSAVGTFAQTAEGIVPTDVWTAQTAWNHDVMDGTGISGMTLDTTKENFYQIRYNGTITFSVEDETTGEYVEVHHIHYSNQNTVPVLDTPALALFAELANEGNTTNLEIKTSSMAGFIEGSDAAIGPAFSVSRLFTIGSVTDEEPILTISNKIVYQSKFNTVRIVPTFITLISNLSAPNSNTTFRTYIGAVPLNGTSYTDVNAASSVVQSDIAALDFDKTTAILQSTFILDKVDTEIIQLEDIRNKLAPGTTFMITAEASDGNMANVYGASMNWRELV